MPFCKNGILANKYFCLVQQPVKTYTVEEAKRKLEAYCAYQDRCHKEVAQKLRDMRMIPDAIDVVIGHLLEHNFLNEERFAKAFARGKFRHKSWGRTRITRELKQRGIGAYNLKTALLEIEDEEYDTVFNTLSRKRYEQLSSETDKYRKRKKLADYLTYRGWEGDLVYEKVKELVP
ncbi:MULTISPECIES: regulatory protein RecX [unclassified Dokdonia]|jgi:regulatory protein|uniref:regulatory protein RecX n=1 Tax=unclassified Dokdonia TaxID=2615033 RepID=UPI00020A7C43|nr:regulatory protein RecX [Dokdonia sp. 4H-3-7-5]